MPPLVRTISTLVITGAPRLIRIVCKGVGLSPGAQLWSEPLTVMIPDVVPVWIAGSCDTGMVPVLAGMVNAIILPDGVNLTFGSSTGMAASDTKETTRQPDTGSGGAGVTVISIG